jgi:hydroxymethylpyrimidine pyrophosphatase-like HAD family hydrolase
MEMLGAAGNPVCVSNAVPSLKSISIYETCHARDGALYDCFKHFGLI